MEMALEKVEEPSDNEAVALIKARIEGYTVDGVQV